MNKQAFLWKWTGTWTEWKMYCVSSSSSSSALLYYLSNMDSNPPIKVFMESQCVSNDVTLLFFTCFDFLTFWLYALTKSCRGSFFFTSNINLYLQNHSVVTAYIRFYSSSHYRAFSLLNKYQRNVDISLVCQHLDKPFALSFEVESLLREKNKV